MHVFVIHINLRLIVGFEDREVEVFGGWGIHLELCFKNVTSDFSIEIKISGKCVLKIQ